MKFGQTVGRRPPALHHFFYVVFFRSILIFFFFINKIIIQKMTREKLVRIVERYKLIIKFQPEETNVKERETHTDGHVITH